MEGDWFCKRFCSSKWVFDPIFDGIWEDVWFPERFVIQLIDNDLYMWFFVSSSFNFFKINRIYKLGESEMDQWERRSKNEASSSFLFLSYFSTPFYLIFEIHCCVIETHRSKIWDLKKSSFLWSFEKFKNIFGIYPRSTNQVLNWCCWKDFEG